MPGLPGIELPLIFLGELNAPKSCWRVVGTRQRGACREEFASSSKTPLAIQSCCHLSKGDNWGSSYSTYWILRRFSSRLARKCVDLADLAKRAMHADRKVSGSKDTGGA